MSPTEPSAEQPTIPADLVVLSDLHLADGRVGDLGRYSPMEEFFFDDEFARFLRFLQKCYADDPSRLKLVLNGDIFDFLTVTALPEPDEAVPFEISDAERRFGLNPTPSKSVFKLERIAAGHPVFFRALARFVAAGHEVVILRGNHDLELYFVEVQDRLLELISAADGGPPLAEVERRITLVQWFHVEAGRVYIEHGHEYEASNSIRYTLRPLLPPRLRKGEQEPVLDYPLGSLFVRYFYNGVSRMNPYTPKFGSLEEYLGDLGRYNLLDVLRIARDHYPFFVAALKREATGGTSGPNRAAEAQQHEDLGEMCDELDEGELPRQLNQLKIRPMSASKLGFVQGMTKPILKRVGFGAAAAFVSLYLWLVMFNAIQLADSVFSKAILLLLFSVITMAGLFWLTHDLRRRLRGHTDETVDVCAERAAAIGRLTGAKMVLMGHTHTVDIRKVGQGCVYANSGTWTSVDNPWDRLHPDARRFTFLLVQGDQVEARRWNDAAGRTENVPLFVRPDHGARTSPLVRQPPRGPQDRSP